jgi:hypothetical protein
VKFLLNLYLDPARRAALTEEQHGELSDHREFVAAIRESGELVGHQMIADPSTSAVVRVHGGAAAVIDGPYPRAGDHLAGYYLVDCESRERALELAARVPDARVEGVEVRPLMSSAGMEM